MTNSRNQPLTPSALAREASDGMSQRYASIPTIEVINGMRQELRAGNEDPMSTQPNRIIPRERPYSIREAPVNQKHAAGFLNMHPKTVLRRLVRDRFLRIQSAQIGSVGTFTSQS